ncbi:MAG TPA: transposase [Trebonia sp.]
MAGELAAAGVEPHVAEPADTAFARRRKRHAKTGKTDSRHLRELLAEGRLPECWVPPPRILERRALLEAYHDLRAEHTAWVQRVHAVFFHQGAPALGALRTERDIEAARAAARGHLSPAGQLQVAVALHMLAARLYGVGPVTAPAITCWLGGAGRFSSSRKAVRFAGLDITVYSSDSKRSPGRLPRQGPAVLRWALTRARSSASSCASCRNGYRWSRKPQPGWPHYPR